MLNFGKIDVNELHKYIQKIAGKEIDSVGLNPVLTGVIIESLIGYYVVQLSEGDSSSSIKAVPMNSIDNYSIGDSVYIIQGNSALEINYFIFGKVKDIQEEYINLSLIERYQEKEQADIGDWVRDTYLYPSGDSFMIMLRENGILQLKGDFTYQNSNLSIMICNAQDEVIDTLLFTKYDYQGLITQQDSFLPQEKIFVINKDILPNIAYVYIEVGSKENKPKNITISAGALITQESQLKVDIDFTNGLNFFRFGGDANEQIRVVANVYYNNQKLENDKLKYYWFIKDNDFLANDTMDSDYMGLAGAGFRCLNTYQEVDAIGLPEGQKLRIWDKKNNYFLLSKKIKDKDYFENNFISKIKCIVTYEDIVVESNLVEIYNYTEQKFEAFLVSSADPSNIISTEDSLTLSCNITNTNKDVDLQEYEYIYIWSYATDGAEWQILSNESEGKWTDRQLVIKDNFINQEQGASNPEDLSFEMTTKKCSFACKVKIKHRMHGGNTIEEVDSNIIPVVSYAEEAATLERKEKFQYYISTSHDNIFRESTQGGSFWTGEWYDVSSNIIDPIDFIFNDIDTMFKDFPKNSDYYVYYTKQVYWEKEKLDQVEIIRVERWSYPLIARMVGPVQGVLRNIKIGASVDQLNTFNQLTQGGKSKGIFYKDLGRVTKDTIPEIGKEYYTLDPETMEYKPITCVVTEWQFKKDRDYYIYDSKSLSYILTNVYYSNLTYYKREDVEDDQGNLVETYLVLAKNEDNFDIAKLGWPSSITSTTTIYENVENNLFISASYINTGTLRVGDANTEKFYASLDDYDIRIGGFNVTENILQSKNNSVGLNSNRNISSIAIWAGKETSDHTYPFLVTHEGKLEATDADITGKITAKELYIGSNPNNFETTYENDKKSTAKVIEGVSNTANDANLKAEQAKRTANTAASNAEHANQAAIIATQKATSNTNSISKLTATVNTLSSNTLPATYLKVVPEGSDSSMPNGYIAIKSKDDDNSPTDNPGMIFFNTDELVINSDNLRLLHDGKGYKKDHFELITTPLTITPTEDGYSLTINTDALKFNTEDTGPNNLEMTGKITATGGQIGGFIIDGTNLLAQETDSSGYLKGEVRIAPSKISSAKAYTSFQVGDSFGGGGGGGGMLMSLRTEPTLQNGHWLGSASLEDGCVRIKNNILKQTVGVKYSPGGLAVVRYTSYTNYYYFFLELECKLDTNGDGEPEVGMSVFWPRNFPDKDMNDDSARYLTYYYFSGYANKQDFLADLKDANYMESEMTYKRAYFGALRKEFASREKIINRASSSTNVFVPFIPTNDPTISPV